MRNTICALIATIFFSEMLTAGGPPTGNDSKPFHLHTCRSDFGSYAVSDGSDANVVMKFVQSYVRSSGQDRPCVWQLTYFNTSPGGYHYTFCQTYADRRVFGSELTINVSRQNRVYSIFDNSYDLSTWSVNLADFSYQDLPAYQAYVKQYFPNDVKQTVEQVIAMDESANTPELCYLVNLKDHSGHQRDALVARDRIIYEHDACMYRSAPVPPSTPVDSQVTGMVFRPDPLTTAHVVYYAPYMGQDSAYQNFNDADTPCLNIQREQRSFYANYDTGTFFLSNKYVQLVLLDNDPTPHVTSDTPVFNYTRSQNGLLDVMVFYHLNTIRSYVHSLGFNAADMLIMPDSHAFTQDNDYFSSPDNIYYGTGGVPDCQDADVIVHEYTHFISWNANHSNGIGASSERNSVDEGSADYDAASYSASIDTFKWNWVFNWDGHNEFWPGRVVDDYTVYPIQPTVSGAMGIYKYAQTWSSALMEIWWDIGKGPADSLFFQTLYGLGGNITLPDAAQQYIKADSLLFNGQYHCRIVHDFHDHGLASDTACGLFPLGITAVAGQPGLINFTAYPDGFKALAVQSDMPVSIDLYDITGQRLATYNNVNTEIKPSLPDGIYIVNVTAGGIHQAYKWALVK